MEEVDERAFLFGGKCGADTQHLAVRVARIHGDLFDILDRLEGPCRLLGVQRVLGGLLQDGCELGRGDDYFGMLVALHIALVGTLKGGADGDDASWARYL